MQTIGAFEAKTHLSSLLDEVEQGQIVFITRHGKLVAKLSPVDASKGDFKQAVEKMKAFQSDRKIVLGLDWKELRDQGRK